MLVKAMLRNTRIETALYELKVMQTSQSSKKDKSNNHKIKLHICEML